MFHFESFFMNKLLLLSLIGSLSFSLNAQSQNKSDTLEHYSLPEITIQGLNKEKELNYLRPIHSTYLCSGTKNEVICLSQKNLALSEKYARQIFSKVPGVFVYDMDGTGNQMNISTRGLDPHRGWEFNIRKDFVITNSDMYGYPASHYNIPIEAVERIELLRGTAAVQYGAQFGGMLNYVSKQPDSTRAFAYEGIHTLGSYDLISSFHRFSGTISKWKYNVWVNKKWNGGYRENSDSEYNAEGISISYSPQPRLDLKFEWTHSNYIIHLAGPLNDSMFAANPQQSTRSRNYYNPNIHVPSVSVNYKLGSQTKLSLIASSVLGYRNSVMFDRPVNIPDTLSHESLQYANRQVDIDQFNSYTVESRLIHEYKLKKMYNAFVFGAQYMNNDLFRRQQGKGTTASDFDLTIEPDSWVRSLHYKTKNIALFAENLLRFTPSFSMKAGLRYENGASDFTGLIRYYADSILPNTIRHQFPLIAVSSEYDISKIFKFYAGWSQAFRPVILKDIIPGSIYEEVNKDLKDADGYNFEVGLKGHWGPFRYDLNYFILKYNNRLGTLAQTDDRGNLIIYRTNIGDSKTSGVESYLEWSEDVTDLFNLTASSAVSYMHGIYTNASVRSGNENVSINGNKVESVPDWIIRSQVNFKWRTCALSILHSYTSSTFADPLNTVNANSTGSVGWVPEYHLFDLSISIELSKSLKLTANASNLFDKSYFTKRPQFYPGPGIWPSDGRTLSATISVQL